MDKELRKLMKDYPIGTCLNKKTKVTETYHTFNTEQELITLKRKFGKVKRINDHVCETYEEQTSYDVVQGYMWNGCEWKLMANNLYGWDIINLEENKC